MTRLDLLIAGNEVDCDAPQCVVVVDVSEVQALVGDIADDLESRSAERSAPIAGKPRPLQGLLVNRFKGVIVNVHGLVPLIEATPCVDHEIRLDSRTSAEHGLGKFAFPNADLG